MRTASALAVDTTPIHHRECRSGSRMVHHATRRKTHITRHDGSRAACLPPTLSPQQRFIVLSQRRLPPSYSWWASSERETTHQPFVCPCLRPEAAATLVSFVPFVDVWLCYFSPLSLSLLFQALPLPPTFDGATFLREVNQSRRLLFCACYVTQLLH